jgi:hypothetical protein
VELIKWFSNKNEQKGIFWQISWKLQTVVQAIQKKCVTRLFWSSYRGIWISFFSLCANIIKGRIRLCVDLRTKPYKLKHVCIGERKIVQTFHGFPYSFWHFVSYVLYSFQANFANATDPCSPTSWRLCFRSYRRRRGLSLFAPAPLIFRLASNSRYTLVKLQSWPITFFLFLYTQSSGSHKQRTHLSLSCFSAHNHQVVMNNGLFS